ncbi:BTAD domain-containing putative transcriptional regulator [Cellulomonas sp. URHE0023]|uniref:BTAD domain-containing putative transcriptional regulator n=1 Tax=Cellulomonas sp. URHE0023 TaxID=1380354 RepID=UPI000488C130|nr:BTAD domain-containing putative transcriptional regulator [Cellulomonas sp. URHE0023]
MLEVRVLGPTAVTQDVGAELDLGARKHAEVLAVLAARRGRHISAETLADLVWRGEPPPSAITTLQGYIARLRRILEPDRPGSSSSCIVTVADGYRLDLETDATRFEAEVRSGRELVVTAPARAVELLAAALARWRGTAFADVKDIGALGPEIQRLEELHVVAREAHAQALLAAGGEAEAVPELRALVVEHPLRERGPELLATALYRGGRQADALAVLRELRERLVEELGVDPGPDVVALEQRLLQHDPGLSARPAAVPAPSRRGFAGRDREVTALRGAWDRARAGTVATAVIRGEAGIGKTRLVEELLDHVVIPSGGRARWGRCPAAPGAPAYWPWAQVLGGMPAIDAQMEAGRFAIGLDLGRRLGELAGGGTGVVVVLDDAHWADPDSLLVLEIALDTLVNVPLLLILTARDDAPHAPEELGRVLAAVARRPEHLDLRLTGLSSQDAASLLVELSDLPLAEGAVERLVVRTQGNPYFLRSLAALGPDADVPSDVRDTVRSRVRALPSDGVDLVGALGLAGRELPLAVAAAAAGTTPEAIELPLAAAMRAGLIEESAPGRLRVTHELVREAVVADLGPGARLAIHTRLADALATGGTSASAAVAEHRLAAAAGSADDRASRAALAAASVALASAALDDAVSWAHRGLAAATDDDVRADLHRIAGTAARRAGRLELSEAELREEALIARRSGDWTRLAESALESAPGGIGGYWSLFGMPLLGRNTLLDEALTHVDDVEPTLGSRLLAAASTQLTASDSPGAAALADRALAEAGTDRDARARALVAVLLATWTPDTAVQRLGQVQELLALGALNTGLEATAAHLHRCVLLELGRPGKSAQASRAFTEIARRTQDPDLALLDTWWEAGLRLLRGELDEARELARAAAGTAALASPAAATLDLISRSTVEGIAAWHAGRLIDVVGQAADLAADTDPAFLLVVALGHAEAGNGDIAIPLIDGLLAQPPTGQRAAPWSVMLAAALIALGDAGRLAPLIPILRSFGPHVVVLWPGMVTLGPAQLYLGGALAVTGETDEARRVLSAALDQAEALGARPFVERALRLLHSLPAA